MKKPKACKPKVTTDIAVKKLLLGQAAAKTNKLGVRFRKYIPGSLNGRVIGGDDGREST